MQSMKRNIIEINEDKCIGCGLCVNACHQEALQLVDGKAKLISDSYCDGLGKCLPSCPVDAIHVVEKEVESFDRNHPKKAKASACGCPSSQAKSLRGDAKPRANEAQTPGEVPSQLRQWPVQIKLVSPFAPFFDGADLLIAADCCAFSYGNFHQDFMRNKVTLIGCPKLDAGDYAEKLTEIIRNNDINSVTVTRMEVPCCAGIAMATEQAIKNSGKRIPFLINTITTDGDIL